MKTIKIPIYNFSELEETARRRALDCNREINIDTVWWDEDFDHFRTLCKSIGIEVDEIYFRGFYSQGDGSCFESTINVSAFVQSMEQLKDNQDNPLHGLNLAQCPTDRRVIDLIKNGKYIESSITTKTNHGYYYVHVHSTFYLNSQEGSKHNLIVAELQKFEEWAEKILERLNKHLYENIERTYDYLISDNAVVEAIEANQYVFTHDGMMADRLLFFAENQ